MLNYEPGDEIYLFGFSRGAYTARSVSGLIRNSGILKKQNLHLVDKAYDLYRDKNDYSSPDSDLMKSFRLAYSQEEITPIYFIGVWDTVGSLGVPLPWYNMVNLKKYKFHDVTLSSYVRHAYHALAIDEKRKLFQPTLWTKSSSVIDNPDHPQKLEQRWFSGVHSNVGGGYKDSKLSNLGLQWLLDKAADAGLCFNEGPLIVPTKFDKGKIINSYTFIYWFWLPKPRKPLIKNQANESIDESAWDLFKTNPKYRPPGLTIIYNLKNPEKRISLYTFRNIIQGVPALFIFFFFVYLAFFCLVLIVYGIVHFHL
jgi:hypothetical protein